LNLAGIDLRKIDLSEVNLENADLSEAILTKSNLARANLSKVNLRGVDLRDADVSHVDLGQANLEAANISQDQLDLVKNLQGATMPDGKKYKAPATRKKSQQDTPEKERATASGLAAALARIQQQKEDE
jgi:uncharacterized protein YjbI with pentapeptide repeats